MVGQALFYDTDVVELHMGFKPVNKACIVLQGRSQDLGGGGKNFFPD